MFNLFLVFVLTVSAVALNLITKRKLMGRIRALEQDLQVCSEVLSKMGEVQVTTHHKFAANFEHLEERIMELSVPSHDANLPLERRHQVLTLARKGIALEDIAKRLKAPVGEAELILNLRKYMGGDNEQVSPYV